MKYDPFGNVVSEESPVQNNFRFPGQYHDRESGLYYNWNRYYIPQFGRYSQVDFKGNFPFAVDNYSYVLNNPLLYDDPEGLQPRIPQFKPNAAEGLFCLLNPNECIKAIPCAYEAYERTYKEGRFKKHHDFTSANAFLHCYLSCCYTKKIGPSKGKSLADAHENYPGNPPCARKVDLYNNVIGTVLGTLEGSDCDSSCTLSRPLLRNNKPGGKECKACPIYR